MADGPYTTRALQIAAHAPNCGIGECEKCDKAGLAALLVLPSVADPAYAAGVHDTIAPLLKGVADPVLTASGYVIRTLRRGYVMAYYADNPKASIEAAGQGGWTIARVDAGGYMMPTRFALVESGQDDKEESFACSRTAAYASALLFVIPNAKRAGNVWVAFSTHPWSKQVRDAYTGSEALRKQGMTCINASTATCERSIKLTTDNLSKAVADFTPNLDITAFQGNPFPVRPLGTEFTTALDAAMRVSFLRDIATQTPRPESATEVVAQAKVAIERANNGFTLDNAMIVSLPDPEGITTTTAQRRITLCNTAAEWIDQFKDGGRDDWPYEKTGYWRLQSALTIEGLLKIIAAPGEKEAQEAAKHQDLNGKPITRTAYNAQIKAGTLPANAGFMPDTYQDSIGGHVTRSDMGTLTIPTPDAIRSHIQGLQNEVTQKLTGKAQGMNWKAFLDTYKQKVQQDKDRLARFELDHKAWLQSDSFRQLHEHNFDDATLADGLPYARCINHCLMGGPLTKNAMAWWDPFLGSDPNVKNNLLVRAMLGNQQSFFGWFTQLDQVSKTWDELKGVLDLEKELREKAEHAEKQARAGGAAAASTAKAASGAAMAAAHALEETQAITQQLITTASAVAAAKDEAGTLTDTLRVQLKKLSISLMGKSREGLEAVKLQVPVEVFARLCRAMAGHTEELFSKAGEVAGRKVRSVVLSSVLSLGIEGKTSQANALVDLYLWIEGKQALQVGKQGGKYALNFAEVTGKAEQPLSIMLTEESARDLAKNSMRLMRGAGAGVLSAGSGFLQALSIGAAVKQFQGGGADDREAAALSFISGGMGLSAALLETGGSFAKQYEKMVAVDALKSAAAYAAGFSAVMDAMQALINRKSAASRGDSNAEGIYAVQAVFFGIAAVATLTTTELVGTALGWVTSSVVAAGMSWTGIGLVFVALGVLAGFSVLIYQDKPIQTWAAESIWGTKPSSRFKTLFSEQVALNEVLLGIKIDFNFRSELSDSGNWITWLNQVDGSALNPDNDQTTTREAWLRMTVAPALLEKMSWVMQIYAKPSKNWPHVVAQKGSSAPVLGDAPALGQGIRAASQTQSVSSESLGMVDITLSVRLDASQYDSAYAQVRISTDSDANALLTNCDLIVDEHRLT